MLQRQRHQVRSGLTVVECAVVYPVTFLLLLGLIVGGMGIFRYQEVASLARSGARYASTHGVQLRKDAGSGTGTAGASSATSSNNTFWYSVDPTKSSGSDTSWAGDVYDQSIRPNLVALDPRYLDVKIGWPPVINQADKPDNWPGSRVSVTVSYRWMPELYLVGPITLTSTSTMAISN
jgi:Flp pilus assembly protein TadG